MMVSSAVLGAAAGTGLALVIAVTIVVYRYYTAERKGKSWSSLDRWPDPPKTPSFVEAKVLRQQLAPARTCPERQPWERDVFSSSSSSTTAIDQRTRGGGGGDPEAVHVLDCYRKAQQPCYYSLRSTEFNVTKEHHAVQPPSSSSTDSGSPGPVQSGSSRPSSRMGLVMGRTLTSLSRQASSSSGSQEQLPASTDQQQQQQQPLQHQSSSPQIRTYGPDGRHHNHHEALHAAASYPPSRGSRSPSPVRAASLDARTSPSPSLLLTAGQSVSGSLCSLVGHHQHQHQQHQQQQHQQPPQSPGRCLSPLLIPPPRASFSLGDSGSGPPASPLGALQPDLYTRRDGPIFLSNSRRSGKPLGQLHLRLSYDYNKSDLDVHLIEAQNLPSSDHGGFNDPYIKLTLSPEVDARKRQTPVWGSETNPQLDQHFKFPVSHEELQDKTLILQVLDFDRTSRNDMFGSMRVALDELDLTSSTSPVEIWGDIGRERKPPEETQEVLISLSYLPSAQRLTLVVHRARNLFPAPGRDSLDPFVKVGLLSNERRVKKKKTAICKATRSPAWDEAMSFNVPTSALNSSAIEICVVDSSSELAGNDAIIGTCIIGPGIGTPSNYDSASNPSREHWLDMTNMPRKTISMWHTLH